MCLAQGHNRVTPVRLEAATLVLESSTLPLSSLESMYFQLELKTVLVLIRWLLQKPADLDILFSREDKSRVNRTRVYKIILPDPDSLKLKIKHNDWLLADTCLQTANHCGLF